jgi:2-dehydropantoate 2-reductase
VRISILGLGAMGSVVASCLASTEHELHLHVRGERGAHQMIEGIQVSGFCSKSHAAERFQFSCEELEFPEELIGGSDLVIIACKSYAVPSLLPLAQTVLKGNGVAFAMSNGLGHHERLARELGHHRVLAATTTHGAYRQEDGAVVWAGQGVVNLATTPFGPTAETLSKVELVLNEGGLSPMICTDAASMVWEKVLLNVCINPLAALGGLRNGELLGPELFGVCMMVYREAAKVAQLERVTVPDEPAFEKRLREVLEHTQDNNCSMLQDLKTGRTTEIDALNQAVVMLAEEHGVPVPLNQLLSTLIQACHP